MARIQVWRAEEEPPPPAPASPQPAPAPPRKPASPGTKTGPPPGPVPGPGKEAEKLQEYQEQQTVLQFFLRQQRQQEGRLAWYDEHAVGVQPTAGGPLVIIPQRAILFYREKPR